MTNRYSVSLVGAGYISQFHFDALKLLPNVKVTSVCDPDLARAKALAARWAVPDVYPSVEELIASRTADAAHVLVPPDLHRRVAEPLLESGIHVLLEKPLAVSTDDCRALVEAARRGSARLGVNHNATFRPAFLRLQEKIAAREFGGLRHLICHLNVPLRQLAARQFSHWMFRRPQNIVLEQAVHPLSQIYDLAGDAREVQSLPSGRMELAPGLPFYDTWQVSMTCERATAQLFVSVGQDYAAWGMTAICEDGVIRADFTNDRCTAEGKHKWLEFYQAFDSGLRSGAGAVRQSAANAAGYVLSQLKLRPKNDPFIVSINNAVAAFYRGLDEGTPFPDGQAGTDVVAVCERISSAVALDAEPAALARRSSTPAPCDALVIGGTGFIGTHVLQKLLAANLRVRVLARNTRVLPEIFHDSRVEVVAGDIADAAAIDRAVAGAPVVIHLAHGGGGETWEDVRRSMVEGTRVVAEACLKHGARRLVYAGTIASLYLGNGSEVITGETGNDAESGRRALYSRGKAACEELLNELRRERGLPVVILRPGLVVGEGGQPFHSGLGFFNVDAHCLGWNRGTNPLPFVLVEDVAEAILLATRAEGVEGKSYNVVGDVRPTAREYVAELSRALGRPLHFHAQSVVKLQLIEIAKWIVKRATGRRDAPFPSFRDLKSRGLAAQFDCSDIKRDLKWQPVSDRAEFIRRGVEVYRGGARI
jgi:predicted dehydrogenase/nucleoside-diphosphate-sugar epimerase